MTNQSLSEKVIEWLNKTGTPLELKAFCAFKNAGFYVSHSSSYLDPEQGKTREIDVVAEIFSADFTKSVKAVVECKATDKPWIVFVDQQWNFLIHTAFGISSKSLPQITSLRLSSADWAKDYFKGQDLGGYSLKQAFSDREDSAYTCALTCVKAAFDIAGADNGEVSHKCFALPLLVVDSPIFECRLDENDHLSLREVTNSQFSFVTTIKDRIEASVRIVNVNALDGYAENLKTLCDNMVDNF